MINIKKSLFVKSIVIIWWSKISSNIVQAKFLLLVY